MPGIRPHIRLRLLCWRIVILKVPCGPVIWLWLLPATPVAHKLLLLKAPEGPTGMRTQRSASLRRAAQGVCLACSMHMPHRLLGAQLPLLGGDLPFAALV